MNMASSAAPPVPAQGQAVDGALYRLGGVPAAQPADTLRTSSAGWRIFRSDAAGRLSSA